MLRFLSSFAQHLTILCWFYSLVVPLVPDAFDSSFAFGATVGDLAFLFSVT